MIYVISFFALVGLIGLITNKLNAVTPCQHDWDAQVASFKCCKCGKVIPDFTTVYQSDIERETLREAA